MRQAAVSFTSDDARPSGLVQETHSLPPRPRCSVESAIPRPFESGVPSHCRRKPEVIRFTSGHRVNVTQRAVQRFGTEFRIVLRIPVQQIHIAPFPAMIRSRLLGEPPPELSCNHIRSDTVQKDAPASALFPPASLSTPNPHPEFPIHSPCRDESPPAGQDSPAAGT